MNSYKKKMEFLKEYKALCLKHNLVIDACGCCESPWVVSINDTTGIYQEYNTEWLNEVYIPHLEVRSESEE